MDVGILDDDLVAGNFKVLSKVCRFGTYCFSRGVSFDGVDHFCDLVPGNDGV